MKSYTIGAAIMLAAAAPALAQQSTISVKEETHGLLAQATVKPDSAQRVALLRVPGGRVTQAEIEKEHGKLVYSFDIKVDGRPGVEEILVNAATGAVEGQEHENDEDEASEASQEGHGADLKEEEAGLLSQATVRPDSARHIAMSRVPGGQVSEAVIEREDGKIVYSFEFKVAGKAGIEEIVIDARTGAVLKVEHED